MPLYSYNAYDSSGKEISGTIDAQNAAQVRKILKERQLAPISIEVSTNNNNSLFTSKGLTLSEQAKFSRQLSALLKGGVTLTKALAGIESQQAWQHKKSLFISIRESIEKGNDLSTALCENGENGEHENIFSPALLSIIKIGESTGKLDYAFARIATYLSQEMEQRRRFISAITYPLITAVVSIGVMAFLMVYLVPVIAHMFVDVQNQLPHITRLIIFCSQVFSSYWHIFSIATLVVLVIFRLSQKILAFRLFCEKVERKLPVWGRFVDGMKMESWARSTSIMLECGVNLLDSVSVLIKNESAIMHMQALESVQKSLEKGSSFSEALRLSGGFPVFVIQMIEAGEASGELSSMLESAANEIESENRVITELFLNLIEPLLIVVMGVVVGSIMIGILLPMYEMNRLL